MSTEKVIKLSCWKCGKTLSQADSRYVMCTNAGCKSFYRRITLSFAMSRKNRIEQKIQSVKGKLRQQSLF